jgi:hypothetical protein
MLKIIRMALCVAAAGFPLAALAGPAPDTDGDGIPDVLDNCSLREQGGVGQPGTCDTDQDGYGNACDADLDGDGDTDINDFLDVFKPAFDQPQPFASAGDHDCDGDTDINDFISTFKPAFDMPQPFPPGPSGLPCAGTVPCN